MAGWLLILLHQPRLQSKQFQNERRHLQEKEDEESVFERFESGCR
jgi:transposase